MEALEGDETDGSLGTKKTQFDPSTLFPKRSKAAVHFDAFPMGRWEVVWLGDVGYHSRHMMYSQPTVTVVLASLDEQTSEICEIKLPVAQLFAVYLGSVWHDKVRTDETSVDAERRTIVLTARQAIPCAVGVGLEDELNGGFMLPFEDFAHHREHTKSWCLRVKLPEAIYIFPALELIRFYFGSSGSLLKQVFSPGLDINRLATERSLHEGAAKVTLAYDMPSVSASDIARICFDKVAQEAARLVGRSLQAASAVDSYGKLYPRAAFPFSGRTELRILGVMVRAQSNTPRFVVQRIVSCSAPFPFKRLDYVASSQSKRQRLQKLDKMGEAGNRENTPTLRKRSTSAPITNAEPKRSTNSDQLLLQPEARFVDLMKKPVSRVDGQVSRQVLLSHLAPLKFGSTGNGIASSRAQRCDLTLEKDYRMFLWRLKSPTESWKPFFLFLNWLASRPWIVHLSFAPIDVRQANPHYRELPELVDADGVLLHETMATHGAPRLASLVNIGIEQETLALLSLSPRNASDSVSFWAIGRFSFNENCALSSIAAILANQIELHHIASQFEVPREENFSMTGEALRFFHQSALNGQ